MTFHNSDSEKDAQLCELYSDYSSNLSVRKYYYTPSTKTVLHQYVHVNGSPSITSWQKFCYIQNTHVVSQQSASLDVHPTEIRFQMFYYTPCTQNMAVKLHSHCVLIVSFLKINGRCT